MRKAFCSYFNKAYLPRGIVCIDSILTHVNDVKIFILSFDDVTVNYLRNNYPPDSIEVIDIRTLEACDKQLCSVKPHRSTVEYFWTCSSAFIYHVMCTFREYESYTYVDADQMFFSDTKYLYDELRDCSIAIHEHRYSSNRQENERLHGIFNVGLIYFRNDSESIECVKWWRAECIKWCHMKMEDGKFGDQKYLEEWPRRFTNVKIIKNEGVGLAPWNVDNYSITCRRGVFMANDKPVVLYHFQGVQLMDGLLIARGNFTMKSTLKNMYRIYLQKIMKAMLASGINESIDEKWHISQKTLVKLFVSGHIITAHWGRGLLKVGSLLMR